MKKLLMMTALVFTGALFAQDVKPEFEEQGDLIKGTFFYEDGAVKQKGTYKDGKLHGKWVAYDKTGAKTAVAQYANGKKTGKWFFWNNGNLTEVDYSNNTIAEVTTWDNSKTLVVRDRP